MKINEMIQKAQRKAITPIIATVLIIAVTLIAAVAIGGFVFGIFGSAGTTANVSVTTQDLSLAGGGFSTGGTLAALTCATTSGSAYLTLTNTGTASSAVTGVTLTWSGYVNSYTVTAGTDPACTVGGAGSATATVYLNFPATEKVNAGGSSAVVGGTYTGTVTMANGAVLIYTGSFVT